MLPPGHSSRPATMADAEAILALVSAYNERVIGRADTTLDQIRTDLAEPGFAPETDSWLVHGPDGALLGYGWAYHKGAGQVQVDVIAEPPAVDFLFARVLARADEMAPGGVVDMGFYRADDALRAAAERHGFAPATAFHRMRIDHDGDADPPIAPRGVTLRSGRQVAAAAHAVLVESFEDHFGWVGKPFADWQTALDDNPVFDWPGLTVAELDGTPVGVLLTNREFVEDEDCGYVADLGVLKEARGRGIAGFLLRTAFAADRAAGLRGTILHVDTNNTTPALSLYENAGMRPVLVIDAWRRAPHPFGGPDHP
ncbi:GNAT family N-acetyltransferase [Actinokineospora sp. UTMC 2448]|uniref:GNAT family N-acetyltransferase n=1 Tax=Actinokineospora sp. UTMC 2448 TaxID=2268449 RepID=UPI0021646523|nr:GNAT family N-acetyltransferase [Actinokineospora sp. UTMC 2448]